MQELTQEYLQPLFNYRDGFLYWRIQKSYGIHIGDQAGSLRKDNYYSVKIDGKLYKLHRLIFLYHYGYLPKFIDHIDSNKGNNKIENLREATRSQNGMNRKSYKNSSSKYKGVSWYKQTNKWRSQIKINNKLKFLGYFSLEMNATKAYNKASIKYYGKYGYLNMV